MPSPPEPRGGAEGPGRSARRRGGSAHCVWLRMAACVWRGDGFSAERHGNDRWCSRGNAVCRQLRRTWDFFTALFPLE